MTNFFISYTGVDKSWAEWIAFVLEENGFKTVIQAWDFRPGNNFVVEMQEAAAKAERTVMVLSPDYLASQYAEAEWVAAFAQDPKGLNNKLVPVMVRQCDAPGLLASIVQIRIFDMPEDAARDALLTGIDRKRAKPSARPVHPGTAAKVEPKAFPGPTAARMEDASGKEAAAATPARRSSLIPTLKAAPTDIEKRRF